MSSCWDATCSKPELLKVLAVYALSLLASDWTTCTKLQAAARVKLKSKPCLKLHALSARTLANGQGFYSRRPTVLGFWS